MGKSEKKEGAFEYFSLALRCMKCGRSRQSNHIFLSDALRSFCALLLNFFFCSFFRTKVFFSTELLFSCSLDICMKKGKFILPLCRKSQCDL